MQDWLYDEGEEATKAVYIAKMDEIRAVAGPIVQRYFDKVEEERAAAAAAAEAELAAKRAAAEEAKKAAEKDGKAENGTKDEEMTDAETVKPDEVDETK
jgi:heat shock 70kDa protein 4